MTGIAGSAGPRIEGARLPAAPVLLLTAVVAALAAVLLVPATLPIGANYWDLVLYFDAANRILDGQVPSVDFFTPAGPLGYWLFSAVSRLFPAGQPLLVAQWSLLIVTGPLMMLVLADIDRRSRATAFALLVPFLVFSILPTNVEEYSSYPGVDGFGIYNRQSCQILYVLAAALVFAERRRTLAAVVAGTMLALFLTKVTGFLAGGMLCALAFAAGRIPVRLVLGIAAAFLAVLGFLEAAMGIVSAYLADIAALVRLNEGSLLPRFLQASSLHFEVMAPASALVGLLLALERRSIARSLAAVLKAPAPERAAAVFDHDAAWLGVALFAGLFFETQNTGGQAFIFLWPVLLRILVRSNRMRGAALVGVLSLVAASSLPTPVEVVHRSARALVGQIAYRGLEAENLKTLGAVTQRPEIIERAGRMLRTYADFPETYRHLAAIGELPSFTLYSEPDFQLTWLLSVDEAVEAVKRYEADTGLRFETIMSLNFVNPFPWLLDRHAPRLVAIGADPFRAVPKPDSDVLKAVRATDLLLYPKCPVTTANIALMRLYEPGLSGHRRVALSPCWDAFVRDGLARD